MTTRRLPFLFAAALFTAALAPSPEAVAAVKRPPALTAKAAIAGVRQLEPLKSEADPQLIAGLQASLISLQSMAGRRGFTPALRDRQARMSQLGARWASLLSVATAQRDELAELSSLARAESQESVAPSPLQKPSPWEEPVHATELSLLDEAQQEAAREAREAGATLAALAIWQAATHSMERQAERLSMEKQR